MNPILFGRFNSFNEYLVLFQYDIAGFSESGSHWPLGTPRREWQALAKRRNTADDGFPARPQEATQMSQSGVAALEKGLPFSADCALSWII